MFSVHVQCARSVYMFSVHVQCTCSVCMFSVHVPLIYTVTLLLNFDVIYGKSNWSESVVQEIMVDSS